MHPDLVDFYVHKNEPHKSCLAAMREIVLGLSEEIKETKKYGTPCYLFRNKPLCYIWIEKKSDFPYFLIVEGQQIDHPALVQGDRKRMKILPVDPAKDLDTDSIDDILKAAMKLYGRNNSS